MDLLVIVFAKCIGVLSGLLGKGTNLPGQVALKLRPGILKTLAKDLRIALVTGTNGKTTTTAMLENIMKETGERILSNASGANMKGGIVSSLIRAYKVFGKRKGIAVLEVDEAYLRHITAEISPEVIAVTNIFRDQLDRYGELDKTLSLIEEGCKNAPGATLVLNGDEPMLCDFLPESHRVFYGFSHPIRETSGDGVNVEGTFCKTCKVPFAYTFVTFNHLGAYACPVCGACRPALSLSVDKIDAISQDASRVSFSGLSVTIPQAGAYNIYNGLCAAACARAMGANDTCIQRGLAGQKSKFGRQETIRVKNADVRMILVKNPAGAAEAIASVLPDEDAVSVGVILNDNVGDGKDVSWIYDVEFETLRSMHIQSVFTGGTRGYDMAVRLQCADFENITVLDDDALVPFLESLSGRVYLFVTYSAMVGVRAKLHKKKYIRKLWQ